MSGVYLIVWDENAKEHSDLLKVTKGGYPHITVAYTGKLIPKNVLLEISSALFSKWALVKVLFVKATVNSFFESSTGKIRHDVLLLIDKSDEIEKNRDEFFRGLPSSELFSMQNPHVTHGIYYDEAKAKEIADAINADILPYEVVVTGVTID